MSNLNFKDKIHGAFYGCAIGDALGLAAEFMTKQEVAHRYPRTIRNYDEIYRDSHRSQWAPGDWTSDTDIVIVFTEAICNHGAYDLKSVARAFSEWYHKNHVDITPQYRFIFRDEDYVENPEEVSLRIWTQMGADEGSNEANGRSVFSGMLRVNHLDRTAHICRITHADPRCISSCIALGQMSHDLMWTGKPTPPDEIIDIVRQVDEGTVQYVQHALDPTLDWFDLDNEDSFWYANKNMGATLWAVWHDLKPIEAFDAIVAEGGDADTNASSALSMLGILHGPEGFPEHLREGLTQRERLERVADRWLQLFKDRYNVID